MASATTVSLKDTVLSDVEDFWATMSDLIVSAPQTLKASLVAFRVSLIGTMPDSQLPLALA